MISVQRVQLPVGAVAQRRAVVVRAEATSTPPPPPEANPNVCAKCGIDLKDAEKGCKDGRIAGKNPQVLRPLNPCCNPSPPLRARYQDGLIKGFFHRHTGNPQHPPLAQAASER